MKKKACGYQGRLLRKMQSGNKRVKYCECGRLFIWTTTNHSKVKLHEKIKTTIFLNCSQCRRADNLSKT